MKKLMYAAVCLTALVACSKEQDLVPAAQQTDGSEGVLATAMDFVAGGDFATAKDFVAARDFVVGGESKTVITQNGSNAPAFAWKAGDVIGIIPMNNETVQSNYKVAEIGSNPKQAKFDGGVWALKEGKEYAAYYPFKKEALISNESTEFSFLGQTQSANNSLEHLGAYDYMYASAVVPQSGSAQFDFEHKISLVRLQLTVPTADTYSKLFLESSADWFAGTASLKLSDGTMTAIEKLKSATINMNNIVVAAGSVLTVWFVVLPTTALSGQTLNVNLFGNETACIGEITDITTLAAGNAYSFAAVLSGGKEVEYVDLGLPSGLKWATCNIGASKPEEYGGYYQWAGTQDVTSTGIYLDWTNCPYHTGSGNSTGWTKYIPSDKSSYWSGPGSPDNRTVLDPDDDVAHVELGGKWRMPTDAEWSELRTNCTWTWKSNYNGTGKNGYLVTGKKNGNCIFLPAAGCRRSDYLGNAGYYGGYWSSSLGTGSPTDAYYVGFNSGNVFRSIDDRYSGQSVRPVSE